MKNIIDFLSFRSQVFINLSRKCCCHRLVQSSTSLFKLRNFPRFNKDSRCVIPNKNCRQIHTSVIKWEKLLVVNDCEKKKLDSTIIYYGELTARIKGLKIFSCVSSLGTGLALPWLLQNTLSGNNQITGAVLCTCLGIFTFSTPILIHLVTKKYVTEIAYNSATDTYTATTLSFFLKKINIDFKVEDVTIPSQLPLLTTMVIKEKPLFVFSECFFDINHYIKMMGYDKPIDIKLNATSEGSENIFKKL